MLSLVYKLTTYKAFILQLAHFFEAAVVNDMFEIPAKFGSGYFKVFELGNGIEALTYNFKLNDDWLLTRQKEKNEHYILILDNVEKIGGFFVSISNEPIERDSKRGSALYLTSFLYDVETLLYKNVLVKGLRVLLNLTWMQQYLQVKDEDAVLLKYISLKTAGIGRKSVDAESKALLNEIQEQDNASLLSYQNKILRLVEKFFSWLYDETKFLEESAGISRADIESAQKVESILTHDVTVLPPTIAELARKVMMSESKLKKIFKTVYGLPPYEYYQKHRMQKARLMILSGKYSIKDVGYTLGYSNLSNFTLAFKKAFGKLPSEMARR